MSLINKNTILDYHLAMKAAQSKIALTEAAPDPAMGGGGAPPMDPSMMGGGMPPMDPSMMGGGAPPVDPSMGGGMPPMDPAMLASLMGGAAPPPTADPAAVAAPPTDPAADPTAGKAKGKKIEMEQIDAKFNKILNLMVFLFKHLGFDIPPEMILDDPASIPDVPGKEEEGGSAVEQELDKGPDTIPSVGNAKALAPISMPGNKTGEMLSWGDTTGVKYSQVDTMKAATARLKKRLNAN